MTNRKAVSGNIETEVLYKSSRRCCLCFGLDNDFGEKSGQIAHLDKNNANNKLENLAFLCLEHHDKYDSRTSQSKGLSIGEAKKYRNNLHLAVEKWRRNSLFDESKEYPIREIKVASDNEILILISEFYNASKNVNYDVASSILDLLKDSLLQYDIHDVRIEYIKDIFKRHEVEVVQTVGKSYNATAFIWGHYDDGGMFPRYTILRKDKLKIPNQLQSKLINLRNPPDDFPIYIHHHLPSQITYLVQFTVGQIYFWKNDFKLSKLLLENALNHVIFLNKDEFREGLGNLYFYLGFISIALNEKYEVIEQSFTKGIELGNSHPIGYVNRAAAHFHMGNNNEAISDLSVAIDLDRNNAYAYYGRGVIYMDLGKFDLAMIDFTKALEINKSFTDAYYNRGNIYRLIQKYQRSILEYTKAIEIDNNYINAYHNRGLSYSDLDVLSQALEDYNTVIKLNKEYPLAYNSRGNLYKRIGNKKEAFEDYIKATQLDPRYDIPHYNLGKLYVECGEIEKGISEYDKAIELNSKYAKAYYNRGNAYSVLQRFDNALSDYSKSIELEPEYAGAYANRGTIYKTLGYFDKAISDYDKAISLDSTLAPAYFNRGYIYLYINQPRQAVSDLLKFIEIAPDEVNKQNIIDLINSLK